MKSIITSYKIAEYSIRYIAEGVICFGITYGQIWQPELISLVAQTALYYHAAAVCGFYLLDFIAYSLLHPIFYDEWNDYHDQRSFGMLLRGSRDLLQAGSTLGGFHLFMYALTCHSLAITISAAAAIVLTKGLIDVIYDVTEAKISRNNPWGKFTFHGNSFQLFGERNGAGPLLSAYELEQQAANKGGTYSSGWY